MSHRGVGVHGQWRNQTPTTFSRVALVHGEPRAWRVFVGVELPKLPPVPDVIAGERRLAQQARASSIRVAKAAYNKRRRQLEIELARETITPEQFYRLDDDAYAKCNALTDAADRIYGDAVRGLDQLAVANG